MPKICRNCGAVQEGETDFCIKCGQYFDDRENLEKNNFDLNENFNDSNNDDLIDGSASSGSDLSSDLSSDSDSGFDSVGSGSDAASDSVFSLSHAYELRDGLMAKHGIKNDVKESKGKKYTLLVYAGYIFSILIPVVAIIIGIFLYTRKEKTAYLHGVFIIIIAVFIQICAIIAHWIL